MKEPETLQEPFLIAKTKKGKYKVIRYDGTTVASIPLANGDESKKIALAIVDALKQVKQEE